LPNAFRHDAPEQQTAASETPDHHQSPQHAARSRRWHTMLGTAAGIIFILLFIAGAGDDARARISVAHDEWLPADLHPAQVPASRMRSERLRPGDHAVAALQRLGFSRSESHRMVQAANASYQLKSIRAGQRFKRIDDADGTHVYYNIDARKRLHLHRPTERDQWQAEIETRHVFSRLRIASGIINGSLFGAAEQAGMDQRTTMNLVDIFAWDIDFARDMRAGDTFKVVYEARFDDEGNTLESSILAAEFVNQGRKYQAVRYEQADGRIDYFTPGGKSMRKAYLRAPVKFSRISSRFTLRRKHPILGYTRAHRGVDYAAPRGTPVHAIGDGYIAFKGWKGGYGRFILIRHNNRNHATAYGHLSRYARGIRNGRHVRQGQVIGYVGMSGLATGPHLHFEFRVRGRAVNPLTVKHPPARPVAKAERDRFLQQTAALLSKLNQASDTQTWG
jgi:murein DD-endopeptidase MepM/ murein hydrolase activator NlpD